MIAKALGTRLGYIFDSLRHFTAKLRNFSKLGMLFQAMLIFLPISIFFKILSKRGKVHCCNYLPFFTVVNEMLIELIEIFVNHKMLSKTVCQKNKNNTYFQVNES